MKHDHATDAADNYLVYAGETMATLPVPLTDTNRLPLSFIAVEVAERSRAPFWHRLSEKRQKEEMARTLIKGAGFMASFRQPKWCGYPGALEGPMGCMSLMLPGRIQSFADCEGCDLRGDTPRRRGSEASMGRSLQITGGAS